MRTRPSLVLLLPGNPGRAAFYRAFAGTLTNLGHEVVAWEHGDVARQPQSLASYARGHARRLSEHLALRGRALDDVEVTVVGHSVGAFIAYELARAGTVPVSRAVFLFPFIAAPTLRARVVLRIFANRAVVLGVRRLLRALPARLRRRLIAAAGARTFVAEAEELLCGDDIVRYSEMAAIERRELLPRRGADFLAGTPLFTSPERFGVFLTPGDRWVAREVPGSLRGAVHWLGGDIDHAFVVDQRQSAEVAAHVHAFISRTAPIAALGS